MKTLHWIAVFVVLLSLVVTSSAAATVPQTMTYHGNLSSADGEPVDTVVEATFRIYDDDIGGSEV